MTERNETNHRNDGPADAEDLARLLNYPAIGELFSEKDSRRLDDFRARLNATRENLERVVRYGNRAEAESAQRAARGIAVTLEFLESLQKMRLSQGK